MEDMHEFSAFLLRQQTPGALNTTREHFTHTALRLPNFLAFLLVGLRNTATWFTRDCRVHSIDLSKLDPSIPSHTDLLQHHLA